jgi:hypothetical protein
MLLVQFAITAAENSSEWLLTDPTEKIELKAFYCQIHNDNEALKNEQDRYKENTRCKEARQCNCLKELRAD